ncbi:toast rack family protein [Pontibacter chitinilyticus]|uniref:toast rack family protein n=1 Tax=Pontibacter chitinilyticus TaxID=2674989 RepID=UPI00321B807C
MKYLLLIACLLIPGHLLLAQSNLKYLQTVSNTGIKKGNIHLEVPAGELRLRTGNSNLVEAEVHYTEPGWKPSFSQHTSNSIADLTFKQPDFKNSDDNNSENKWNVSISKTTPVDLYLKMGAGDTKLDLSNSRLGKLDIEAGAVSLDVNLKGSQAQDIDINAGVGEVKLDLTGNWDHDVTIDIAGGIGEVTLKLPKGTGVKLKASGLGDRDMAGLRKNGSYYTNSAFGKSKNTLTINVSGGLGSVRVTEE